MVGAPTDSCLDNDHLQDAVEQQAAAAAEVRAAAAEVRAAAAAPVTLGEEQWGLLGRRLAALQTELQVSLAALQLYQQLAHWRQCCSFVACAADHAHGHSRILTCRVTQLELCPVCTSSLHWQLFCKTLK